MINKILISLILIFSITTLQAKEKCKDLPGYKKVGKNSIDVIKCLTKENKFKLNTNSKLTDWIKKSLNK